MWEHQECRVLYLGTMLRHSFNPADISYVKYLGNPLLEVSFVAINSASAFMII